METNNISTKIESDLNKKIDHYAKIVLSFVLGSYDVDKQKRLEVMRDFLKFSAIGTKMLTLLIKTKESEEKYSVMINKFKDLHRVINNYNKINTDLKKFKKCSLCLKKVGTKKNNLIIILPCAHFLCEKCHNKQVISKTEYSEILEICQLCKQEYALYYCIPKPNFVYIQDLKLNEELQKSVLNRTVDKLKQH